MVEVRTWRFNSATDAIPEGAGPGDLDGRRAVFLAAPTESAVPLAWLAVDDYDGDEGTVLFGAPPGDSFHEYVRALLVVAIDEGRNLGFASLRAHWRGGWNTAESVLRELGFAEAAPGIWKRHTAR
jgi:hypothetical protein